jgi:hypothetical protein
MSCCCSKIKELCSVQVCEGGLIETGIVAPATGEYKLVLDFLGTEFTITKDFLIDEDLSFPAQGLNENFKYTGKVLDPNGDKLSFGEELFDCVSFQTKLSYEV